MKTEKILIDTNIWYYSYVETKETEYIEIHNKANEFIINKIEDNTVIIYLNEYQVAEILEVLRKGKVDIEKRDNLIQDLIEKKKKFSIVNTGFKIIKECYNKSKFSNIHIYDYLVVYTLKDIVDKIYSADDHFQHKDFTSICEVINPLKPWILREGRKPKKE